MLMHCSYSRFSGPLKEKKIQQIQDIEALPNTKMPEIPTIEVNIFHHLLVVVPIL